MPNIAQIDLEELVMALQSQDTYDHLWLIDPETGEITFASRDLDPELDLDECDLVRIDALPSWEWYQDMADFAEMIPDERAGRRLSRAIQGRGAFRRFKDELHDEYPQWLSPWYEFSNRRGIRRAVKWLLGNGLVTIEEAERFLADHPDIELSGPPRTSTPAGHDNPPRSDTALDALIEHATNNADTEDQQHQAFYTALAEHLTVPFTTQTLGVNIRVEGLAISDDNRVVALCERNGARQPIGILDLPLPEPAPEGSEWIAAYRRWATRR